MLSPAEDREYLANQAAGYESYRSMNLKRAAQGCAGQIILSAAKKKPRRAASRRSC